MLAALPLHRSRRLNSLRGNFTRAAHHQGGQAMIRLSPEIRRYVPLLFIAAFVTASPLAHAKDDEKEKGPEIPVCEKKIGSMAVAEPETKWWLAYNLESPEALLKVYAAECKCFTLLDRGKGL